MPNVNQIQVEPSSLKAAAIAGGQRLIIGVVTYYGATGYVSNDDAFKLSSAAVGLALALYGAYRTYRSNEDKKAMERQVPNEVATLKR